MQFPRRVIVRRNFTPLRRIEWVVYSKRPFGGPEAVLAYLSRYTHPVAISNSRLIAFDTTSVTFKWKDYRAEGPVFLVPGFPAGRLGAFGVIRNFRISLEVFPRCQYPNADQPMRLGHMQNLEVGHSRSGASSLPLVRESRSACF